MVYPQVDLDHVALADKYYKIHETESNFYLFDVYCWLEDKLLDEVDDIGLWETKLPYYIFPKTHSYPEFIREFHACYDINQRVVVTPT